MACDNATAAETALVSALAGPKSVSTDGLTVENRPIPDLIAAEEHLAGKCAARRPGFGIRIVQLKTPGSA